MQGRGRLLLALVRLGRPQFLIGGFLLYGLGAASAALVGAPIQLSTFALGQAAITSIQLMTHYANDYFDLAADRANLTPTRWSGGSRVLPSGLVSPRWALIAAGVLATTGLILSVVVAAHGAPAAAVVLILALVLAWFYSAPPLVLHSRGCGELTTAVVVTGLTPLAGFILQRGDNWWLGPGLSTLCAILWPLWGLQFVMLLAIEFPDAAGDRAVGKRTLVVRLGGARAAALYRAVLVAVYGGLPLLVLAGAPARVMLSAALPAPVAVWQFRRLESGAWNASGRWESLAFWAVALLVGTAACEVAALLWLNLAVIR